MALNPQYDAIGKAFVQQYYTLFDDANQRANLSQLYNPTESLMTFEGVQMQVNDKKILYRVFIFQCTIDKCHIIFFKLQGVQKIMEKIGSLTFQRVQHSITAIDCQPMFNGGILINVLGQLKTDDDPAQSFIQTFLLTPMNGSFVIQHDTFRLVLHNVAA